MQDTSAEHTPYRVISHTVKVNRAVLDKMGRPRVRLLPKRSKDGRVRLVPTPVTESMTAVREQLVSVEREAHRALGRGRLSGRQWIKVRKRAQREARYGV